MTWEYALIGLIIGFIISALVIRFFNIKVYYKQTLKTEFEKKNHELKEYHKELISHFIRGAELLDNMAKDYRQLYQHIAKNSHELFPDILAQKNPFNYRLTKSELNNDQDFFNLPPKDYPESSSHLFHLMKEKK
ncbi:MAG: Z-ring associated protein ZapG [Arsenophonus sp. ET-YP4-MAG3]